MIKLVAFDWNGVLIADAKASVETVSKILEHFGRAPITVQKYREIFTVPVKNMYRQLGFSEEKIEKYSDTIQDIFHRNYEPRLARVRTRSGARALLSYLRSKKVEAIIFSNHTHEGIETQAKRFGIATFFSHIIANDKYSAMKNRTKGEKLEAYLRDKQLKPSEVLIIGDTIEEIEIGKQLRVHTVAITGGYCSEKRLKDAQPNYLIHNLRAMIDIVRKYE